MSLYLMPAELCWNCICESVLPEQTSDCYFASSFFCSIFTINKVGEHIISANLTRWHQQVRANQRFRQFDLAVKSSGTVHAGVTT